MRWNRCERRAGSAVFAATLLLAYGTAESAETAAARVRPGMTRAEVVVALGTPAGPSEYEFHATVFVNAAGVHSQEERDRLFAQADEWKRQNRVTCSNYYRLKGTVVVMFRGPEGEERVAEARPRHRMSGRPAADESRGWPSADLLGPTSRGVVWWLLPHLLWCILASVQGAATAELLRRACRRHTHREPRTWRARQLGRGCG